MCEELPKLSSKQNKFIQEYITNGNNATEAYRVAYKSLGKTTTCCVEGSKLLKNPNISLWLKQYRESITEEIKREIKYEAIDAFNEFEDMKIIALESLGKDGKPNVSAANKAIEMKCRLMGLMKDDPKINNAVYVDMPTVEVDGQELKLNIGEDIEE